MGRFDDFTFRCSSLGYIMSDTKDKSYAQRFEEAKAKADLLSVQFGQIPENKMHLKSSENLADRYFKAKEKADALEPLKDVEVLSDTCKTHLCDVYTRIKYGRIEDIKSKYLTKGLLMEEDAITMYSELTGEFYKKNDSRLSNGWIEGETDFFDDDTCIDTKVNWSIFQFNRVVAKPIKPLYHWQLEGYCWLWGRPNGKLVYCLLNTPEHLIAMEEKKLLYDFVGSKEDYEEACKELRHNHIYDDIPLKERVRQFNIVACKDRRAALQKRIISCRKFLNDLDELKIDENEMED